MKVTLGVAGYGGNYRRSAEPELYGRLLCDCCFFCLIAGLVADSNEMKKYTHSTFAKEAPTQPALWLCETITKCRRILFILPVTSLPVFTSVRQPLLTLLDNVELNALICNWRVQC